MGVQRTTFEKLQRERNKKAKAAAKRARREERGSDVVDVEDGAPLASAVDAEGELSAGELLQQVEQIHRRFEAKLISFEEFEEAKADLMARITVD